MPSHKKVKTVKINENIIEKSAILDYYMNETNKNNNEDNKIKKLKKSQKVLLSQKINPKNATENSKSIKNSQNSQNKITQNYYLICPNCHAHSPHIEKLYYHNNSKDFLVKYTSICNNNNLIPKEIPLIKILNNKEPLNVCNIHLNNKLINYCKTCKRAICSACKEEQHNNHDLETDIIDKPISKEDANKLLETIKEKEEQYIIEINKNEEKMENGIDSKILKLNEEKINYKKLIRKLKRK